MSSPDPWAPADVLFRQALAPLRKTDAPKDAWDRLARQVQGAQAGLLPPVRQALLRRMMSPVIRGLSSWDGPWLPKPRQAVLLSMAQRHPWRRGWRFPALVSDWRDAHAASGAAVGLQQPTLLLAQAGVWLRSFGSASQVTLM